MSLDDRSIDQGHLDAIADADPIPLWLDRDDAPESNPTLVRDEVCDLCVVGAGYTGLWTAILAKERDPNRDVVIIERREVGSAASGRNGGFCDASLTHGFANARARWPDELRTLEALGWYNLEAIEQSIARYGIDCDFRRSGTVEVATFDDPEVYYRELRRSYDDLRRFGYDVDWLDTEAMQAEVHSPTYRSGMWDRTGCALVDPARLAWGLKATAESLGVRIYEDTEATDLERTDGGVRVETPLGVVTAARVALATNAFKPLLKRLRNYIVPVYDYCMVTEPLTPAQLDSIGWTNRQGIADFSNQFHYYRLTESNRILWGGYDAIYYRGGDIRAAHERRPETWAMLSANFFETFPQLEGVRFSHAWGGVIDTSSRFSVFWGTALRGRVGYALGYTGLGVGASRFGASVMLDLLDGIDSEATRTKFVRTKPVPFPPEPFRFLGIQATRWSLNREDQTGKRNLWLRTLDRLGMGFDS
jgi:glycine/D-amino acid oxidase-like deaminating enzyme